MNNYTKLTQAVYKIKYKCGDCGGKGKWKITPTEFLKKYGKVMIDDLETIPIECNSCSGKGFVIPLEFGCELKLEQTILKYIGFSNNQHALFLSKNNSLLFVDDIEDKVEILGKPITPQDILLVLDGRELSINKDYIHLYLENKNLDTAVIDLTLPIKDQSESTLSELLALIEL